MAEMIPFTFYDNGSQGEKEIFEALRDHLPKEYTVLHSVRWIHSKRGRTQGEADFVILHPKKGLLVIEVKSGILKYLGRQWQQKNRGTGYTKKITDPEHQASESKFKFIELLKQANLNCMVAHAVWFPSIHFSGQPLPPNYHTKMLFDMNNLMNPKSSIDKAFSYWQDSTSRLTNLNRAEREQVLRVLAPELELAPDPKKEFERRELNFLQLTNEQTRILDYLEFQQKATIAGLAGTGKTLIAIEKAKRLAVGDRKVLFLCFNRLLKDYLRHSYAHEAFDIKTFDGLIYQFFPNLEFEEGRRAFLEQVFDGQIQLPFEHLVIDEGQDFEDEWLEVLELATGGSFYVFYDPQQAVQNLAEGKYLNLADTRLTLTVNCRNTEEIAKTSYSAIRLKSNTPVLSKVSGNKAEVIEYESHQQLSIRLNKLITQFQKANERPLHRIAMLSLNNRQKSVLNHLAINYPTSKNFEENHICVTTARKFKGLEADLVMILDIDWRLLDNEVDQMLFYTSCARAKHELYICSESLSEEQMNYIIRSIEPETKRKGKRKFYQLFNFNRI